MRVGEALKLDDDDVDWDDGVVFVRESKFGKSRLVPLDHTTVGALRAFVATRDGLVERRVPAVFVSIRGNRMIYACVQETFRRLCDTTGIGAEAPNRPRVHDYADVRVMPTSPRRPVLGDVIGPLMSA